MRIQLKDNTPDQRPPNDISLDPNNLKRIANIKIGSLNNGNVLIYPSKWEESKDKIKDKPVFTLEEKDDKILITTGNVMGFIGTNGIDIAITSRFANDEGRDYFLHYMLQKVNGLNIVDLDTSGSEDSILDFLMYLFPLYLSRAMKQGLYKEYKHIQYNDVNIKGPLDVPRHIRSNIPFQGKIAYTVREYRYDNPVLQLIRHTIEYIKARTLGKIILSNDEETSENTNTIIFHTQAYNKNDRQKIVSLNRRPVTHPYFTGYRPLQRLCLQILRHEKLSFGTSSEKIHGILFDGALLWENYIAKIFSETCPAIQHKTYTDKLFQDGQGIIPDFITYLDKPNTASFIGDTKYKFIDSRSNEAARDDYYQVLTYMYRYSCKKGNILFPLDNDNMTYINGKKRVINNKSGDCHIMELGLEIPQETESFDDFCKQMQEAEKHFISYIDIGKEIK
jgi:5-methylcytosine-specific restriction endonuclease McrBC regulatory subunit McrC